MLLTFEPFFVIAEEAFHISNAEAAELESDEEIKPHPREPSIIGVFIF